MGNAHTAQDLRIMQGLPLNIKIRMSVVVTRDCRWRTILRLSTQLL